MNIIKIIIIIITRDWNLRYLAVWFFSLAWPFRVSMFDDPVALFHSELASNANRGILAVTTVSHLFASSEVYG